MKWLGISLAPGGAADTGQLESPALLQGKASVSHPHRAVRGPGPSPREGLDPGSLQRSKLDSLIRKPKQDFGPNPSTAS